MGVLYAQDERTIIKTIDDINSSAIVSYEANNIKRSFTQINQAISLADSIDDNYGRATAHNTLGNIYFGINDYESAQDSYFKTLETSLEMKDNHLISVSYMSLGNVYAQGYEKQEDAISYYQDALSFAEKIGKEDKQGFNEKRSIVFNTLISLSEAYLDSNQSNEALIYLLRAKDALNNSRSDFNRGRLAYMFGTYHSQINAHHKAIKNYKDAIFFLERIQVKTNQVNKTLASIYKEYSNLLYELDDKDGAYRALIQHNVYSENVLNVEKIKQVNIAKSMFDVEEHKRNVDSANKEKDLQTQIALKTKRNNTYFLIASVFLVVTILTLYLSYFSKNKLTEKLKRNNEELEIAKNEAVKSSEQKSSFIANVSHELRTPLYGVVGLTSLLLDSSNLDKKDKGFLKSLKFSGDHLLNLINDVLQVGKIESKKIEINKVSFNPKVLVKNIVNSFEYQLENKSNQLHLNIDDNLPEYVISDNIRLSQIIINLVGNSLKFTDNGNIWLSLYVVDSKEDEACVRFEIKDDGPGIPKDKQKEIFENFSQLSRDYNNEYQGTGLGLSIAKNLVEMFGSRIELVSEIGVGSEFSFDIKFEVDRSNNTKLKADSIDNLISIQAGRKILIVEDNKINQIVTKNILEKENLECDVVSNGLLAVEAVMKKDYNLILMDLNMPIMDGFEAARKIREKGIDIPIIALTASEKEEIKDKLDGSGFDDLIIKPYDNFEFFQIITKNLYRYNFKLLA